MQRIYMTKTMNYTLQDIEIMAPAGSFESLTAAIQAGANSIYFGIGTLNMRSRSSSNFNVEDLHEIVHICHNHGINSYLTVNTVLYDEDMSAMRETMDEALKAKITAVIVSDVAGLMYARQIGLEVHLSTQLNIANIEALRFYAQFADVVVLARELNMDQVSAIHKQIETEQIKGPSGQLIRIEMFCHGALCMAVSGKCYLSLHEYNASANRGSCYQTCRRAYTVHDKETGAELEVDNAYIMSPKDLKTIHFLNKMLDSGVRVLKIEGRARGPEYVHTVVSCYREALESILDGSYDADKIEDWNQRLSTVFNRGFWNGYYLGQRLGEWTHQYGSTATKRKILIGKGVKYFSKLQVGEFRIESKELRVGDEILITGPTTGVLQCTVDALHLDGQSVGKANKGNNVSFPVPDKIRPSDKLYLLVDN